MSADDGSNDDNTEEIGDLENNSDVCKIHVPELKYQKNKFVNIDEITALDNFDSLLPQEQNVFHYSDAKGTFFVNWHTNKKNLVGRAPSRNVNTVQPGPIDDAKNVWNPLESFHVFIRDDMINQITTNN